MNLYPPYPSIKRQGRVPQFLGTIVSHAAFVDKRLFSARDVQFGLLRSSDMLMRGRH